MKWEKSHRDGKIVAIVARLAKTIGRAMKIVRIAIFPYREREMKERSRARHNLSFRR